MVVAVKAHSAKHSTIGVSGSLRCRCQRVSSHSDQPRSRVKAPSAIATAKNDVSGHANCVFKFSDEALRHAISGPTPVRNKSISPIGVIHWLKNGGPTVMRSPVTASDSVGNSVATRMKNAAESRIQLLRRNAYSRESHESSDARERKSGSR